jgi:hypothetical protein
VDGEIEDEMREHRQPEPQRFAPGQAQECGDETGRDCPPERPDQAVSDRHVVQPVGVVARVLVNDLHVLDPAEHEDAEKHIECLNRKEVRSERCLGSDCLGGVRDAEVTDEHGPPAPG